MCDDVNVLPAWALEMMKRRRSYTASNPAEVVSSPLPFVDGGRTELLVRRGMSARMRKNRAAKKLHKHRIYAMGIAEWLK